MASCPGRVRSEREVSPSPDGCSSIGVMDVWVLLMVFALIKIPLFALLLWLPFREERHQEPEIASDSSQDEGGEKAPIGCPPSGRPSPRRRGPHGSSGANGLGGHTRREPTRLGGRAH
jgi:hypothetical protein